MSGWFFFPCPGRGFDSRGRTITQGLKMTEKWRSVPFIPDSPLCPVMAVKRVIPGWFFFPCHLYQTPPFALLQQLLKGLSLGWFFFRCHLYQTPPFALLRQLLKGLSVGWFVFPCHLYQTPPFALLRQLLKGLSVGWFFFPCHLYQTPPLPCYSS